MDVRGTSPRMDELERCLEQAPRAMQEQLPREDLKSVKNPSQPPFTKGGAKRY